MSLYREAGRTGRGGLIAAAVVLVIGVGTGYLIGHANTKESSLQDAISKLRSDLAPVSNGLELLGGEYPQGVRNGKIVARTEYDGSLSSVERIRAVAAVHADELQELNPKLASRLSETLEHLQRAVASKESTGMVDRLRNRAANELEKILPGT
jgi:hypothetical protein